VGEIINRGEKGLMSLHNFGQKSRQEVEERLKTLGLSFTPPEEEEAENQEERSAT
jgi:DNA-directed RNA polymerase alpha subunit